MKWNYKQQLILSVVILTGFNILNTVFRHWIFSSIGKCLCGLLWIVHPVMIREKEMSARDWRSIQLAGVALLLWGIFSRAYYY